MLPRSATLLEKMLLALGVSLAVLDLPMEFLTLYFDMPWINLFNDVKQGEKLRFFLDSNNFLTFLTKIQSLGFCQEKVSIEKTIFDKAQNFISKMYLVYLPFFDTRKCVQNRLSFY